MGAFDKDKTAGNRLDLAVGLNAPFVLHAADLTGETVTTTIGDRPQMALDVARLSVDPETGEYRPEPVMTCTTIASAIVDKLRELDAAELPCVCELRKVPAKRSSTGEALVIQWVGDWPTPGADS